VPPLDGYYIARKLSDDDERATTWS